MPVIKLDYTAPSLSNPTPPVGPVTIRGEDGGQTPMVVVDTHINGNAMNPIGAALWTPPGDAVIASVAVNGGTPLSAVVQGGSTPLGVSVALADIGLRPHRVKFKLFGLLTLMTMEVGP